MKVNLAASLSALTLATCCMSASAQLAISANDGKQPLLGTSPTSHTPDNVAVIDLKHFPPKVIGTVDAPASMIGPPTSVAVAHDGSFALVSDAQKFDPADATKFVLDDTVSVIDLKDPKHPTVIQTLQAGKGATGISINKSDTLALVAATGGTVSVFSIVGKHLTPVDTLQFEPKAQPVDVAISPDGTTALVVQRSANVAIRLAIDGTKVTKTGIEIPTGRQTYGVVFSPDGNFAYNTNLGGALPKEGEDTSAEMTRPAPGAPRRMPRIGTVSVIDLRTNKLVNSIEVGTTPEHLTLSADGKYLALTIGNGSSSRVDAPGYHPFGLLKVYSVDGANLTEIAEAKTGAWGQGATWNKDHTFVLLQSGAEKDIEVYRFDGHSLTRESANLKFDSRPGAIATAQSR
jgi:DNA-binding beta-propeller fold protein YncE